MVEPCERGLREPAYRCPAALGDGNSAASDMRDGVLDLGESIFCRPIDINMRQIRNFVGGNDAVDNRRTVGGKCLVHHGCQDPGLLHRKAMSTTGAGNRCEVRIWKLYRLPERQRPMLSASNLFNPSAELLKITIFSGS